MMSRLLMSSGMFTGRAGVLWARFERWRSPLIAFLALSPALLFLFAGLVKLGVAQSAASVFWRDPHWAILGVLFQGAIIAGPTLALILTLLPPVPAGPAQGSAGIRPPRSR